MKKLFDLPKLNFVNDLKKSKATISKHFKNIFEEGELDEKVVVRKFRTTTQHGDTTCKTQEIGEGIKMLKKLKK
jgi:hypothetical protein